MSCCLFACKSDADSGAQATRSAQRLSSERSQPGARGVPEEARSLRGPRTLLELGESPYPATLAVQGRTGYLLTPGAAYELGPDGPPRRRELELGVSPAMTEDRIVFWYEGELRSVDRRGGEVARELSMSQPRRLVAGPSSFAWLVRQPSGRLRIDVLDGWSPRVLVEPEGYVEALGMGHRLLYFTEQQAERGWRLGAVPISGGAAWFRPWQSGRMPAMLVVTDAVYYYDGPTSTVRRVSSELEQEVVIARNVICSPIAVSSRVYCAQPAGILEIGFDGRVERVIDLAGQGTVTAMAASESVLLFLMDVGENRLEVRAVDLTFGE